MNDLTGKLCFLIENNIIFFADEMKILWWNWKIWIWSNTAHFVYQIQFKLLIKKENKTKTYDLFPLDFQGLESISDYSVSFHYIKPESMYSLEFFVYHLRPYGIVAGNQDLNRRVTSYTKNATQSDKVKNWQLCT